MTHRPGEDTITGLFTVITLVDMVSGTVVNFLLTLLFNQSLNLEGIGVGLPFFLAAFLLLVVAGVVFSVNATPLQTLESSGSSTLHENSPTTPIVRPGTPLETPKNPDNDISHQGALFEV